MSDIGEALESIGNNILYGGLGFLLFVNTIEHGNTIDWLSTHKKISPEIYLQIRKEQSHRSKVDRIFYIAGTFGREYALKHYRR